jgi:L-fuconate dehydratase
MSGDLGNSVYFRSPRRYTILINLPSYPAYITSAGWLGYSDEKVLRLTKEAVAKGFNHFKMKVGSDIESDLRRGKLIRSVIDDHQYLPKDRQRRDPNGPELKGKNAGPAGAVLMIDANQVWEVNQAIEYTKSLAEIKPWYGVLGLS